MAAEQAARAAKRASAPTDAAAKPTSNSDTAADRSLRRLLQRLTLIIFFTAAVSSIIFQSTTFALPKVLDERVGGIAGSATAVGWLAFVVFAIASMAQLVVGRLLDTLGPRIVFMGVAALQILFFSIMPGLTDWTALAVALGFMLGAFGQIPINDYMIGRMARSEFRASVYGARYVVSFVALAAALPLIAWVHGTWGFDMLFRILAAAAVVIFLAVSLIPSTLPVPDEVPVKA
jgi:MFS family permease